MHKIKVKSLKMIALPAYLAMVTGLLCSIFLWKPVDPTGLIGTSSDPIGMNFFAFMSAAFVFSINLLAFFLVKSRILKYFHFLIIVVALLRSIFIYSSGYLK